MSTEMKYGNIVQLTTDGSQKAAGNNAADRLQACLPYHQWSAPSPGPFQAVYGVAVGMPAYKPPEPSPLTACLAYFRALGLSDEEIRKAITPTLFAALKKAPR